jgi:hypothetical protein
MEAALHNTEPEYPRRPTKFESESKDALDKPNAWTYETCRERSWVDNHREWRGRYLRFLDLGEAVPEIDTLETGRYSWLKEYPYSQFHLTPTNITKSILNN